jgi:hypothetical protein
VCLPVNSVAVQMERVQYFEMLVPTYRVEQCHDRNIKTTCGTHTECQLLALGIVGSFFRIVC